MDAAFAPGSLTRRARSLGYVAGVGAILVAVTAFGSVADRVPRPEPVMTVVNIIVQLAFIAAAAALFAEPAQRRTAVILGAAAVCEVLGGIRSAVPDPWFFIHQVVGPLFWVFGGWALLRFPHDVVLRRRERTFLAVAALWMGPGHLAVSLTLDPRWWPAQYPTDIWWPTLVHSRSLCSRLTLLEVCVDATVACWYAAIIIGRIRAMSGVDRWTTAPMAASIIGAVGPLVVRPLAYLTGRQGIEAAADTAMVGVLLLIPLSFLVVIVRMRITRLAVADMMTRLQGADTDGTQVTAALRTALRDPDLTVRFWSPETHTYVDGDGRALPPPDEDRLRVPVTASDGSHLGELVVDPALTRHRQLVDAAVSASALRLENIRLHAALQAQLEATRASRRRIAEAAVDERRRLERDLHDGVQQRLLALTLRVADMRTSGSDSAALAEVTRTELHAALAELRELARGIHPTVLAQSGLGPALEDVLDRLPLPVALHVPNLRWSPAVEATAYFIVCEALSNVVKHSGADAAEVDATVHPGPMLRVEIRDDGHGGARADAGSGLRGIHDRVRALGGQVQVVSPVGGGTRIVVEIPYDD